MKKPDSMLKEYVRGLFDEDLEFLNMRVSQKFAGDLADIAIFLQNTPAVDRWLSSSDGSEEWYDMVDYLGEFLRREVARRSAEGISKPKSELVSST